MSVTLHIKYSTKTYRWLCFKHATQEAMRGDDVEAEIVDAYYVDMSAGSCNLCDMGVEESEKAMAEWYEKYVGRMNRRSEAYRKSLQERT